MERFVESLVRSMGAGIGIAERQGRPAASMQVTVPSQAGPSRCLRRRLYFIVPGSDGEFDRGVAGGFVRFGP